MNYFDGLQFPPLLIPVVFLWVVFWKGLGLWRSSKEDQKFWFIAILIFNGLTLGILEIVYLFGFAEKKLTLEELKKIIKFS